MNRIIFVFIGLVCRFGLIVQPAESIEHSGLWRVQLAPMNFGKTPGS